MNSKEPLLPYMFLVVLVVAILGVAFTAPRRGRKH